MADEELSPSEVDALSDAIDDVQSSPDEGEPTTGDNAQASISKAQFMQLEELAAEANIPAASIARLFDVKVDVEVILGKKKVALEEVLKLQPGSLVELNRMAGEPVDLTANGKLIARGEVVVIEDHFGIKILEIAGTRQKLGVVAATT